MSFALLLENHGYGIAHLNAQGLLEFALAISISLFQSPDVLDFVDCPECGLHRFPLPFPAMLYTLKPAE
jgi:hypothetical protein